MRHTELAHPPRRARWAARPVVVGALRDQRAGFGRTVDEALDAGVAQAGVGGGLAGPRAAGLRAMSTRGRRPPDGRRPCSGARCGRSSSPRRSARSASPSGSRPRRCSPATSPAREDQAGLAQTFQVLGTAVAAYLLARLMAAPGTPRRAWSPASCSGPPARCWPWSAGVVDSMPCCSLGAVLLGATTAANNGSRYAATDLAPEETRARALVGRRVGDHDRAPSPGPTSPGRRRPGRHAGRPRADRRRSPSAPSVLVARRRVGRRAAAARPAARSPRRPPGAPPVAGRRPVVGALRARCATQPALGAAIVGDGLRPRGDGDGDDHDAAAHGARRRAPRGHRVRHLGARAGHVRLLAARRARRRPLRPAGRAASPGEWSCWSSLRAVRAVARRARSWQIFAGLFLLGLGLVAARRSPRPR